MRQVEVVVSPDGDLSKTEAIVEACATNAGLHLILKGTLAKYPGCVHWHYKKDRERGTLEVTLWLRERRIWFKVSGNRGDDWIDDAIQCIKGCIEEA